MARQTEAQLQASVVDFLRRALPDRAIVFHPANGGSRDKREAAKLKWQGVLAGVPDVIVLLDGRAFGIELKAPKGRLSPEQEAIADRFCNNGIPWACARSLDEVEAFMRDCDVPLRATCAAWKVAA